MLEAKPTSTELWWLAAALLVAATLRLHGMDWLAVEHHDEGVYAANLNCAADDGGEFPSRPFYAPPLWPQVIEWTLVAARLFHFSPYWLPMLPGALAGIALAPSAWWVARQWFGPAAGVAAAWIVATSDYHAFYSRTALTDAPLVLFWLWAVYWSGRALETANPWTAVVAGICTTLAWWTKYNGWIPLAITFSGGVAALLLAPPHERYWRARLPAPLIIATIAGALWSPVLWDCRKVGGYSAVAANHRGYLASWSSWFADLAQQGENFAAYSGSTTTAGLAAALVGAWLVARYSTPNEAPNFALQANRSRRAPLGLTAWLLASFAASVWLAGGALGCWMAATLAAIGVAFDRYSRGVLSAKQILAASLLSAWFLGMLLATPAYRPFPRLLAPLWLAASLGIAWLLAELFERRNAVAIDAAGPRWPALIALACGAMGCALACQAPGRLAEDRTCLLRAADDIAELLRQENPGDTIPAVVVYGEPALFCALTEKGIAATARDSLDFSLQPPAIPTYLASGMFTDRDAGFEKAWLAANHRFVAVSKWELRPSSLVLFDYGRPSEWNAETSARTLRLYRLQGR